MLHFFVEQSIFIFKSLSESNKNTFSSFEFFNFGAGHFYLGNISYALFKLVVFLFGMFFVCLFPITAKCFAEFCNCDCAVICISFFYYFLMCLITLWYIIDLVEFGNNHYYDSNGYPLCSWSGSS